MPNETKLFGRTAVGGSAGEYLAAIRELYRTSVGELGTVLSQIAFHGDPIALLQRIASPSLPHQTVRATQLEFPVGHLFAILHVHIEAGVRIHPLHFGHRSRKGDRLRGIIFRRERMVSE